MLADICTVTIETLSACGGIDDFQPAEAVTRDKLPLELTGCEELCRITFNIERAGEDKAESLGEFHVLVHSEQLGPAVGMGGRKSEDMSAADIRNAIVEHLHRIPVRVTAEFARTDLRLEELMTVQANDIILLDKRIDEPIELTVEGRPLFVGRCVKSEGNYGVLVAGLAEEGE